MKLMKENIETQIMLYADNELSAGEIRDLMAYLEKYPEYKALLSEYQYSVLQPEEMIFEDKEKLFQHHGRKAKALPLKMTIGIAAAIAIILAVTGYYQRAGNDNLLDNAQKNMVVRASDSFSRKLETVVNPDKSHKKEDPAGTSTAARSTAVSQNITAVSRSSVRQRSDVALIKPVTFLPTVDITADPQPVMILVEPVGPAIMEQQRQTGVRPQARQPGDLLAAQIEAVYEQSDRLKGVHSLVTELDERKSRAVDAWQQIKNTNVILKIGSKEIVIK